MVAKTIFKRYELKYVLDRCQYDAVEKALQEHMVPDRYGHSSIRNIYLDTDDFLLARRSIEKPLYKEKLRLRSYGAADEDEDIFVELKRKYDGVVYKRRLSMPSKKAMEWFSGNAEPPMGQIAEEIDFFRVRYQRIRPAMYLSYERDSYAAKDGSDLRITMDSDILSRTVDIDLGQEPSGNEVLPEGYRVMEVKTMYGYPSWLTELLSYNNLYKSSFSKYGNAYKEMVLGFRPEEVCLPSYAGQISRSNSGYATDHQTAGQRSVIDETLYSHARTADSIKMRGTIE